MKIIYVSVHLSKKKNNNKQIKKTQQQKQQKTPTKNVTKQKLKQNKKTNQCIKGIHVFRNGKGFVSPPIDQAYFTHIFMGDWKQNIEILVLFFFYTFIYHSRLCPKKLKS